MAQKWHPEGQNEAMRTRLHCLRHDQFDDIGSPFRHRPIARLTQRRPRCKTATAEVVRVRFSRIGAAAGSVFGEDEVRYPDSVGLHLSWKSTGQGFVKAILLYPAGPFLAQE
jgi:hypothetical protein